MNDLTTDDSNYFKRRFSRQNSIIPLDKYSKFYTIDWLRDYLESIENQSTLWDGLQAYSILLVIGSLLGLLASIQNIAIAFISDFKRGICTSNPFLSKDICCQEMKRVGEYCLEYRPWGEVIGGGFLLDFTW